MSELTDALDTLAAMERPTPKLVALKEEVLKRGYKDFNLDDLVHDAASEIASAVNNGGMEEQLRFLLEHDWTPEDVLGRLRLGRRTNPRL